MKIFHINIVKGTRVEIKGKLGFHIVTGFSDMRDQIKVEDQNGTFTPEDVVRYTNRERLMKDTEKLKILLSYHFFSVKNLETSGCLKNSPNTRCH